MSRKLFSIPAFRFSIGDLASAIGKWSRTATFGDKSAKGEGLEFTPETLGQLVRNTAARGDKLAIDEDHKTAFVATTGQAAPSLGYFYALALFQAGTLLDHWSMDGAAAPSSTDDKGQVRDGLYARLGEITPRGMDPQVGLANYSSLSPMFSPEGTKEDGTPIGYGLIAIAATSSPFQANCPIEFSMLGGADAAPTPASPSQSAASAQGATSMHPDLMKKMGLADGASPADKMAKCSAYAMGDASPDELKAMADDFDKDGDEPAKKLAAKFRKMAAADAPAIDPAKMDQTEPRGTAKGEAQNAAIRIKTGQEHNGMSTLSMLAKDLGLPETAEPEHIFAAYSAKTVPVGKFNEVTSRLAVIESEHKAEKDATDAVRFGALADKAIKFGYPKEKRDSLIKFARVDYKGAEDMIAGLPGAQVLSRMTSGGSPTGTAREAAPVTGHAADADLASKAKVLFSESKAKGVKMTLAEAQRAVLAQNPQLAAPLGQ